jgi:hypothetical protein
VLPLELATPLPPSLTPLCSYYNVPQARNNTNRVFAIFGVYVVASSALFHGAKAIIKGLFRRLPHKGPLQPSLPVVFAADVLLPTAFFGPYLAAYTAIQILLQAAKDKVRTPHGYFSPGLSC